MGYNDKAVKSLRSRQKGELPLVPCRDTIIIVQSHTTCMNGGPGERSDPSETPKVYRLTA
jgi:hypothetical protein